MSIHPHEKTRRLSLVPDQSSPDPLEQAWTLDDLPEPPGPVPGGDVARRGPKAPAVAVPGGDVADDLADTVTEPPAVPVDPPAPPKGGALAARMGAEFAPVVPEWLRRPEDRRAAGKWAGKYVGHRAKYHGARLPLYGAKVAAYAPIGVARGVGKVGRFVGDAEAHSLRMAAVDKTDPKAYLLLSKQRNARVKLRATIVAAAAFVALVALLTVATVAPRWTLALLLAAAVVALARLGRPDDKPILGAAVTTFEAPRLTSAMVVAALVAIGIKDDTAKGGTGIAFPAPIQRDGAGWRADVDLPPGITVGDVMDKRTRLASSLRRPLGCVWPESAPDVHEGRLVLWVADIDPAKAGPVKWVLAGGRKHDIFRGIPFGADPRGRPVTVPLVQHNYLIGSQPGQGKTGAVRVLSCGAALDPTVELWLHELKGSGDLDPLERVSHRFASGIDDASIGYAADSLHQLRREVERRTEALKALPRDLCPDKRVTREIADRRHLGLYPIVCVIDECQNLFAHPKFGGQAAEDAVFIIKIGRAFGVILVLATQRPDKESLPTGISGNVSIRFCLRVAGQVETDMIMGTSSYKNGVRPNLFRPEVDAGTGYLGGVRTDPFVTRVAYLDGNATERVAVRAHALRTAAGTLTGHAIGEDTTSDDADQVLVHVLRVWTPGETAVWSDLLADRLADLDPDRYQGVDATWLGAELRRRGIVVKDVHRKIDGRPVTRKGVQRAEIEAKVGDPGDDQDGGR
jgi:S-DNA-T family DNA segregation ATPase FtsK/SpoIIIE